MLGVLCASTCIFNEVGYFTVNGWWSVHNITDRMAHLLPLSFFVILDVVIIVVVAVVVVVGLGGDGDIGCDDVLWEW